MNGSELVEVKVHFKGEELREVAYCVGNDESQHFVAFSITPNEKNKLDEFSEWYNGEYDDDTGMKYITMEFRDKEQFQVSLFYEVDFFTLRKT